MTHLSPTGSRLHEQRSLSELVLQIRAAGSAAAWPAPLGGIAIPTALRLAPIEIPIPLTGLESALGGVRFVAATVRYIASAGIVVLRLGFDRSDVVPRRDVSNVERADAIANEMNSLRSEAANRFGTMLGTANSVVSISREDFAQVFLAILASRLGGSDLRID